MKVSVIIPNYNHAPYLEKRIESVLQQTYQNFEIIILDDCSTDNSRDIIEKYGHNDKVAHIIYNTKNSGSPFSQWQKGFNLSQGDYIWFAESDDWAEFNFLEILVEKLSKNPSIGLVYCQSNIVDSDGFLVGSNKIWTDEINKRKWRKGYYNNGIEEIKNALSIKNTIPNASAVLLKRQLIINDFIFPVNMKMAGDWLCWIKILKKTDISYVPMCLNNFRNTTMSSRNHKTLTQMISRLNEELIILNYLVKESLISQKYYASRIKSLVKKYSLKIKNPITKFMLTISIKIMLSISKNKHHEAT